MCVYLLRKGGEGMGTEQKIMLGSFLEVTGSFGFGEKQGLVVNEALKKEGRKLSGNVSRIVGFVVRNCYFDLENSLTPAVFEIPVRRWVRVSDNPIKYDVVEQIVTLNPDEEVIIEACDFLAYMLNNKATHGTALRNGVIKQSSRGGKSVRHLSKQVIFTPEEAGYFCFSFSPNCEPRRRLHDPDVKKTVGVKRDGVWYVKDEYKEYFGFLEVSNTNSRRVRKLVQQQISEKIRAAYMLGESK